MDEFIWLQIMAGTEPLNKDGSPPCCGARILKLEMEDKMAQIKKWQLMNKIIGKETYYYNTISWPSTTALEYNFSSTIWLSPLSPTSYFYPPTSFAMSKIETCFYYFTRSREILNWKHFFKIIILLCQWARFKLVDTCCRSLFPRR